MIRTSFAVTLLFAVLMLLPPPSPISADTSVVERSLALQPAEKIRFLGGRLEIAVPPGWRIQDESDQGSVRLVRGVSVYHGFILIGSVGTEVTYSQEELGHIRAGVIEGLEASMEDFQLESARFLTLGSADAFEVQYRYVFEGTPFQGRLTVLSALEGLHSVNVAAPTENYPNAQMAFNGMMAAVDVETPRILTAAR